MDPAVSIRVRGRNDGRSVYLSTRRFSGYCWELEAGLRSARASPLAVPCRSGAEPGYGGGRMGPEGSLFHAGLWGGGSPRSRVREPATAGSEEEESGAGTNDAQPSFENFLLLDS